MYRDTVTIFNRLRANGTDTWYPTVLHGVDLNVDASAIRKAYGADTRDRAKLHIQYSSGIVIQGHQYFLPESWAGVGITFHDGELFDFFWDGEWTEIVHDEDYKDGFFNYMKRNHDMVFAITSIARYSVIPHFEIMGA